jgi:uncharacterized protein (DUF433 family)
MPHARRQLTVPDETLTAAYESGLSLAAVAARFGGVNASHVRAALRRTGKPVRTPSQARRPLASDRDWDERYAAGESATSIARSAAVGRPTVRNWLRRRGVAIRDPAGAATARAAREGRDREPHRPVPSLRDGTRGRAVLALLAGHPGGLPTTRCAAPDGGLEGKQVLVRTGEVLRRAEAAGWVARAGTAPGGWRQPPAVIWAITESGRAALGVAGQPRRAPRPAQERPQQPEHAWAADAEKRARAGASVAVIARVHGVDVGTVRRALDRRGVPHGRAVPLPGWAGDAKPRYHAGESASALASRYGVSHGKVRNVLKQQGVNIRDRKQAKQAR